MEELRSTEVLDKEIETDARKKAERILAKADSDERRIHFSDVVCPLQVADIKPGTPDHGNHGSRITRVPLQYTGEPGRDSIIQNGELHGFFASPHDFPVQ